MALYLCHEQPDLLTFEAKVVLSRMAFYPGGSLRVVEIVRLKGRHNRRLKIGLVQP